MDILAVLGGLEIACLAGLVLGAAVNRLPIAVDGFISTAAYVAARAICPAVADYAVLSHASAEPGYQAIMHALDARPMLDLDFRLGKARALPWPSCCCGPRPRSIMRWRPSPRPA